MGSGARSLRPAQVSPGSCVTGRWLLPGWFQGTRGFPRLRLMTGCVQYFLSPDPQRGPRPVDREEGDLSRAPCGAESLGVHSVSGLCLRPWVVFIFSLRRKREAHVFLPNACFIMHL